MGNFNLKERYARGERVALIILEEARELLEYVATSFVDPKTTVVEKRSTSLLKRGNGE